MNSRKRTILLTCAVVIFFYAMTATSSSEYPPKCIEVDTKVARLNLAHSFRQLMDTEEAIRKVDRLPPSSFTQTNRNAHELGPLFAPKNFVGKRVLDAGTGMGALFSDLNNYRSPDGERVDVEAMDIKNPYPTEAKMLAAFKGKFRQGDMLNMDFYASESFDTVISTWSVFNYEPENTKLLAGILTEFHRVLKPGGTVILSPISDPNRIKPALEMMGNRFEITRDIESRALILKRK